MINDKADKTDRFDEDEAVAFIRKSISPEVSARYSDDEILLVVDTIWDFYASKGFVSLSAERTDDEKAHLDKMTAFVKKEIKADDEILMDLADLDVIIKAELEYEQSIENINE